MLMILIPPGTQTWSASPRLPKRQLPGSGSLTVEPRRWKCQFHHQQNQQQQQHHLHHPLDLRIIYSFAGWNGKNRRPSHLPHRNPREDTLRHLCKVGIFPDNCNFTHCAQHHYHRDSPPQELRGNGKGLKINFPDHRRERLSGWPDHLPKVVLS